MNKKFKFNIIIPQDKNSLSSSTNSKDDILRDLQGISDEDIGALWDLKDITEEAQEEKEQYKDKQNIDNTERCSEEHVLFVKEFILRQWFQLVERDPLWFVKWKPIFICRFWNKIYIFFDYDLIWKDFDVIYSMEDDEDGGEKGVFSYKWVPVLCGKKEGKDIIIYWNQELEFNFWNLITTSLIKTALSVAKLTKEYKEDTD